MKKLIALAVTIISAVIMVIPDPLPFLDEGVVMVILFRLWGWAGVDLSRIFGMKSKKKADSQIIEVD